MMRLQAGHPKVYYFGILSILNLNYLRNSTKTLRPSFVLLKAGNKLPLRRAHLYLEGGRHPYHQR